MTRPELEVIKCQQELQLTEKTLSDMFLMGSRLLMFIECQLADGEHKLSVVAERFLKHHCVRQGDYVVARTERRKERERMIKTDKQEVMKSIKSFLEYQRRTGYGCSQPDVSKKTGITQSQLSNYEQGKILPSLLAAIAIADCFDVSLDYLVGRCQNSRAHKTRKEFKYKED